MHANVVHPSGATTVMCKVMFEVMFYLMWPWRRQRLIWEIPSSHWETARYYAVDGIFHAISFQLTPHHIFSGNHLGIAAHAYIGRLG